MQAKLRSPAFMEGGWGWGDYDEETGESHNPATGGDGQIFAQIRYPLDMNCVGNNIKSITYSINADRIHFTRENRAYGPNDPMENNLEFKQENSFTLDYDGQATDRSKTARLLVAYYPLNNRAKELWQKLDYAHRDHSGHATNTDEYKATTEELTQISIQRFNELIAQAPLTLTATFLDGSCQTKTYTIKAAEDFDQKFEEYHSKNTHSIFDPDPAFYTITEKTVQP